MNHLDAGCNGLANGSAWADVTGGTSPYSYLWSDGQINMTASSLTAGNYSVIITDINGCSTIDSVTITEPSAISVIENTSNILCNGDK